MGASPTSTLHGQPLLNFAQEQAGNHILTNCQHLQMSSWLDSSSRKVPELPVQCLLHWYLESLVYLGILLAVLGIPTQADKNQPGFNDMLEPLMRRMGQDLKRIITY